MGAAERARYLGTEMVYADSAKDTNGRDNRTHFLDVDDHSAKKILH